MNPFLAAAWTKQNAPKPKSTDPREAVQDALLVQALVQVASLRGRRFIAAIRDYQHHPAKRDVPDAPVIWQDGSTKLRDYGVDVPADAPIILAVPSLINRYEILDLDPDHSLLRLMAARGFRPLLVDWDEPGAAERDFALSDYVQQRLLPLLDFIKKRGPNKINLFGYCLGGLLALGLASLRSSDFATLTLMATPWQNAQGEKFAELAEKLRVGLKPHDMLPVEMIQALFATLQPTHSLRKYDAFADADKNGAEARRFVLTEDWLNNGVPLTRGAALEVIGDIYGDNVTGKMQWKIGKHLVDPRALDLPAYVIAPGRDKIVPPESAVPLARLLRRATLHEPMLGHIGLLSSTRAVRDVWGPLISWLEQH